MKTLIDLVSLAWAGLLAGAIVLLVRNRRRAGAGLLALAVMTLFIESMAIPTRLLARLERPYANAPASLARLKPADAIVVCGGGQEPSQNGALGLDFSDSADRVLTGVELARLGKGPTLVIGGGGRGKPLQPVEAQRAKAWIERWGLTTATVSALPACGNTHDEALRTADLARQRGWRRVILVTSAWHMHRAEAVFRKTGLEVTPVACDFRATAALENQRMPQWLPGTESIQAFNLWLREKIGHLVYKLRGWS